ncbi:MAG: cell surface protein SprA [bacterium]|nr:cell surface protein SprA [bacterium]
MSVLKNKKNLFLLALLLLPCLSTSAKSSGIGFQARLEDSPSSVSRFTDHPNRLSAAMYPMSMAVLSPSLLFNPTTGEGDHENRALRFRTSFYKGDHELVPVSVDVDEYLKFRTRALEVQRKQSLMARSLETARTGNRRSGLSIGVALPKRFDRVFGEGGANLRVSGYRRITFSGRSQWDDASGSGIAQQSKFPSLNMEQLSRFEITGTIGSKITVKVSQDNQTDIPLANRLILRYKGDDDDILKTIEAGNTTLSLPNTRFVGYRSNIRGLFGLKAQAQLGNLSVTAIASQEKGSSESAKISATGEENSQFTRDYGYAEGRIFDLGLNPGDTVTNILVWEQEKDVTEQVAARSVRMIPDPLDPTVNPGAQDSLKVKAVEQGFELYYGGQRGPAIVFTSQKRYAMGVYMEITTAAGVDRKIGSNGNTVDTLKYLRAVEDHWRPSDPTWALMWRNCYSIPKGVDIKDIDINVLKGLDGKEASSSNLDYQVALGESQGQYMEILGLDQYKNGSDIKTPDKLLDDRDAVFRSDWGLVIFPSREPFNSDTSYYRTPADSTSKLAVKLPNIYEYISVKDKTDNSEYFIRMSTKARTSVIRLGRANVIEGSEVVTLNGVPLTRGTDYNIQYDFGQVTLLTDEATDPNADVQVEFQYAPFLAIQKKTLLGFRAEYEYSRDLKFGSTILYKSDKAQDRKPRVGQETAKAMVLDFDVSFALKPNFLTKMVNALPLISTEVDSRLQVTAEIAQSRPNPNVDGAAYVDDFESAVEHLSLGIPRTNWTLSSEPLPITRSTEVYQRGTMLWHNPPAIRRDSVYTAETAQGEGSLIPLRLIFRPHGYADSLAATDSCSGVLQPTRSWGGIMRYFGSRVDASRVQLFEIRAKGGKGTLHFDFGLVSEDIDGDGDPDFEGIADDPAVDSLQDIGLDHVPDEDEVGGCGSGTSNPDPAGDNWWFEGYGKGFPGNNNRPPVSDSVWELIESQVGDEWHYMHYAWQNGTEGNWVDDPVRGQRDEENIGQTTFEESSAYLTVTVPLNTLETNDFLVENSEKNGWHTYRVPIREPGIVDTLTNDESKPVSWADVSHVRVWFEAETPGLDSLANIDSVWIADWGFVQSNWRDTLLTPDTLYTTSDFYVASVSEEDNTFSPPAGVEAYEDKTTGVTEAQRGLALIFDSLEQGDVGIATKDLISTEAYSGYRRIEMYVHGDTTVEAADDSVLFFLRLGRDSSNYYEYQSYVKPGWAQDNFVDMDFNIATALKDSAMQARANPLDSIDVTDFPYRVKGIPNINEVQYLAAGVMNMGEDPVSGEVWLDELRITDVRKDVGTAARVAVTGSMADLITYNFSYEHKDAFFRGLSQATRGGSSNNLGSGEETNNMSFGTGLSFHKFLPRSWSARMPISFSYAKSERIPLLRTNSDVVLPAEKREEETSSTVSYKFSISESFARKGSSILFNGLLNRQKVSFSYNRSISKTVNNPYGLGESYNVRSEFDMGIRKGLEIPIFFWTKPIPFFKKAHESKIQLFPDVWRWSGMFNRSMRVTEDKDFNRTSSYSRTLEGRMNLNYNIFKNLTTSYNFNTKRDLSDPDLVNLSFSNPKLGLENNYSQSFRATYDPKAFDFLLNTWNYNAGYSDTYDRSSKTRSSNLSRSYSVKGSFRHLTLLAQKQTGRGSGGGRARRGGVVETDEKVKGDPFYEPALKGLRFLTGWLSPLSYEYSKSMNKLVPGVLRRPSWKYRLGFTTNPNVLIGGSTRSPSSNESVKYSLGTGFSFLGGIVTTIGYKNSTTRDLIKSVGDKFEKSSVGWPELTLRISQFKHFPLIKKQLNWFINIFSPRTGFSRQLSEDANLDRGFITKRSEILSRNPVLSLNLKLFRALSVSGSYTVNETKNETFSSTTGVLQTETNATDKKIAITSKYKFSAPGGIALPLFGRLKFKSVVDIDVNIAFNSSLVKTSSNGDPFVVTVDKSFFSVSPRISYSFSQQIKGGLTGRWQDNTDTKFNKKSHTREIQIWTEIRF